jgi:ABC-2 type transport system permease protein
MSGVMANLVRELRAYFLSPLAYVVAALLLLVNGSVFWLIISFLNNPQAGVGAPLELFFGQTVFFWLVLLFVAPVLTMRLISEERRSGTIEVLMTSPVTEGQVIIGKYLASLIFYLFLWAPTLAYPLILDYYSNVEWGPVAAGYVGIVGIGALFLAVGLLASALSRNQLVAAILTFAMLMPLFSFGLLESLFNGEVVKQVFGYLNLWEHMEDFSRGIVDTRRLTYYASASLFFLFLSARALHAKKWR